MPDQQLPQTGDPIKPKVLKEEHRAKLDSIVGLMIKNKESDSAIKMVVEDFKNKYGSDPVAPATPPPAPETKPLQIQATKTDGLWFPTVAPITPEQMEVMDKQKVERQAKAGEVLTKGWHENATEASKDLLLEMKELAKMNSANQPMAIDNVAPQQPYIPQALRDADRKQERDSITPEVVADFMDSPNENGEATHATHRAIIRKITSNLKLAGKRKEANEISAAAYTSDASDRNNPNIEQNAKDIAEGKLKYNVEKQELYRPLPFGEDIAHGFVQRTSSLNKGRNMTFMNDDERIVFLEKEIENNFDPDKPIPVPGTVGSMIGSEGIATTKTIVGGSVAGFLTKNPAIASTVGAAMSGEEYYFRAYYDESVRTYAQVKKKLLSEGVPEVEAQKIANDKAKQNARIAASSDLAMNIVMARSGLKAAAKPLPIAFNKGVMKAAKDIAGVPFKFVLNNAKEGFKNAGLATGISVGKKAASNAIGVDRSDDDETLHTFGNMLAFHYVVGAGAKAVSAGSKVAMKAATPLFNAMARKPIDLLSKISADLVEDGIITPEVAQKTMNVIKEHQAFMSQFPNVKDDNTIVRLNDLVDEFNQNKAKLEKPEKGGVHEVLHKALNERQKEIEWEIGMLSQKPEAQVKIIKQKLSELEHELSEHDAAKTEGKPGKLEDRAAVKKQATELTKKLDEVQNRLDSPLYKAQKMIDEDLNDQYAEWTQNDMYVKHAQNDPEGFLQFIAEQAQDKPKRVTLNDGTVAESSSRSHTEQFFGKELTAAAVEAYPKVEKPKHTVSQAVVGKIKPKERNLDIPEVTQGEALPVGEDGKISFETFRAHLLDDALAVEDSSFNFRVDIPDMQMSERIGAMKDIEAGKESVRRTKLENAIKQMHETGTVPVTRGRGAHAESYDIPVEEWFGLNRDEQRAVAAEVPKVTDEDLSVIENEGITLQTLPKVKHLFDGFPYSPEQYAAIERHLSAQGEGHAPVKPVSEGSGTNTIPDADAGAIRRGETEPVDAGRDGPVSAGEPAVGVRNVRMKGEEPPAPPPPVEEAAPAASETPYTTDIRHATLAEDAYGMGLRELSDNTGVPFSELDMAANHLIQKGAASDIVSRALAKKSVSPQEKAVLVKLKAAVDQEWETASAELDAATESGGGAAVHEAELKMSEISARAQEIYQASKNAGSQYGMGLNAQKMSAGSDYSIGEMLNRKQAAKGRVLSAEEKAATQKTQRDIKSQEKKIQKAGKKTADAIRTLTVGDKLNKLTGGDSAAMSTVLGLPAALWDTSIKIIAAAVEQGANLTEAISQGIKHIKDNGGFKQKGDDQKFRNMVMNASIDNDARLANYKKRTRQSIDAVQNKLDNEDYTKNEKTPLELDKEAMDLRVQLKHMKDEWDLAVLKDQMAQRTKAEKLKDGGRRVIATGRAIVAGIDDSFTMIQAYTAMIANPKIGTQSWLKHWEHAFSNKKFERDMAAIHNSELWPIIEETKLAILEPQSVNAKAVEEIMQGSLHNEPIRIKGKNVNPLQILKPFERAFTSLGNNLRFKLFQERVAMLQAEGKTFKTHPEEYHAAASAINNITGRGGMPTKIETASQYLTPIIWSPRLIASSLNLLGLSDLGRPLGVKGFYSKLTPTQRKWAITQQSIAIGTGLSVLAGFKIANMSGAENVDADLDPRSVTFGNVRVGNKSYNVFGRFAPYVKLVTQVGVMAAVNGVKGDGFSGERIRDGGVQRFDQDGYNKPTTWGQIGKFSRGKMTPLAGSIYDAIAGEQFFTQKDYTWDQFAKDNLIPLSFNEVGKNLERDGTFSLVGNFLLGFEGLKVSDQRDFARKPKKVTAGIQEPKAPEAPAAPEMPQ